MSYNRFIELVQRTLVRLYFFTQNLTKTKTGCYFLNSKAINVYKAKKILCAQDF